MKKFLASAVFAAGLIASVQGANAAPVTLQFAADGFDGTTACAGLGGSYSGGAGGTCTASFAGAAGGVGDQFFDITYGNLILTAGLTTASAGGGGRIQPQFWLTADADSTGAGHFLVGAYVSGYTFPISGTPVPYHFTNNSENQSGTSGTIGLYVSDTGAPYGSLFSPTAGNLIQSFTFSGLAAQSGQGAFNYSGSSYDLGWLADITTTGEGHVSVEGRVDRVPAPTPLALLGLGLAALAVVSRRKLTGQSL